MIVRLQRALRLVWMAAALMASATVCGAAPVTERLVDPQRLDRRLVVQELQTAPVAGVPAQALAVPVPFELGSALLQPEGRRILDVIGAAMNDPMLVAATFVVEGHTDSAGSEAANLRLSNARAQSALNYLQATGVAPGRLLAAGYGEWRPLPGVAGTDARNRRVTIVREY